MRKEIFIIDPKDNVATLVSENGTKGATVQADELSITLLDDVPFGHKFAIKPIPNGTQVLKYGYSIGTATRDIQPGEHVHIHNLESNRGRGDLATSAAANAGSVAKESQLV